jgi:hypothetical protein
MMRKLKFFSVLSLLLTVLLPAACADAPTGPGDINSAEEATLRTAQAAAEQPPECEFGGTYPLCWDAPTPPPQEPGSTCTQMYQCGGGGTYDPPPPPCDPYKDPKCYQPLSVEDKQMLAAATTKYWRPLSEIPDSAARSECSAMRDMFNSRLAAGLVFRGATDTPPNHKGVAAHYGAYDLDSGRLHFDPYWLDQGVEGNQDAQREIANTALHEAAHGLGKDHTDAVGGLYVEAPFNLLHPGTNSCMRY